MVATEHVRSGSSVPAANLLWVNTSSQCTQITRSLFQAGWRPFASGVPTPLIILLRAVIGPWATPDCEHPCKSGMLTAPLGAHFTAFRVQTRRIGSRTHSRFARHDRGGGADLSPDFRAHLSVRKSA